MDTPNVTNPVNPPDSTNNTKVPKRVQKIDVGESNVMKRLHDLERLHYKLNNNIFRRSVNIIIINWLIIR